MTKLEDKLQNMYRPILKKEATIEQDKAVYQKLVAEAEEKKSEIEESVKELGSLMANYDDNIITEVITAAKNLTQRDNSPIDDSIYNDEQIVKDNSTIMVYHENEHLREALESAYQGAIARKNARENIVPALVVVRGDKGENQVTLDVGVEYSHQSEGLGYEFVSTVANALAVANGRGDIEDMDIQEHNGFVRIKITGNYDAVTEALTAEKPNFPQNVPYEVVSLDRIIAGIVVDAEVTSVDGPITDHPNKNDNLTTSNDTEDDKPNLPNDGLSVSELLKMGYLPRKSVGLALTGSQLGPAIYYGGIRKSRESTTNDGPIRTEYFGKELWVHLDDLVDFASKKWGETKLIPQEQVIDYMAARYKEIIGEFSGSVPGREQISSYLSELKEKGTLVTLQQDGQELISSHVQKSVLTPYFIEVELDCFIRKKQSHIRLYEAARIFGVEKPTIQKWIEKKGLKTKDTDTDLISVRSLKSQILGKHKLSIDGSWILIQRS